MKVQFAKEEERYCKDDGSCLGTNIESGWSEWSTWYPCDRPCGRGSQSRVNIEASLLLYQQDPFFLFLFCYTSLIIFPLTNLITSANKI